MASRVHAIHGVRHWESLLLEVPKKHEHNAVRVCTINAVSCEGVTMDMAIHVGNCDKTNVHTPAWM